MLLKFFAEIAWPSTLFAPWKPAASWSVLVALNWR